MQDFIVPIDPDPSIPPRCEAPSTLTEAQAYVDGAQDKWTQAGRYPLPACGK
jgi:hypothetical protein